MNTSCYLFSLHGQVLSVHILLLRLATCSDISTCLATENSVTGELGREQTLILLFVLSRIERRIVQVFWAFFSVIRIPKLDVSPQNC